jgi:23S rRNA (guanosine2251-2'-O)-methyltransferase
MRKLTMPELGRKSVSEFRGSKKIPLIIVLDNVRSAHNVGSVFRTADAFLAEAIYLCGITAKPPHREIQKTALGATETVSWKYFQNTSDAIKELKENNFTIISVEQTTGSIQLNEFVIATGKKYAIVFGNEANGVDEMIVSASDFAIEIPQSGTKHSLNISVCAGIVVWDFFIKSGLTSLEK